MKRLNWLFMFLFFTLGLSSACAFDLPLYPLPVIINGVTYQHGAINVDSNGNGQVWYYNQTEGQQLYMCHCQCPMPLNPTVYPPYNRWDIFFTEATFCSFSSSTTTCTWNTVANSNFGIGNSNFIIGDGGQAYSDMDWVNTDSGLCSQGTFYHSANWPITPPASDHFIWPIVTGEIPKGKYGSCGDWPGDPNGCYYLSDTSIDPVLIWRDVQPFQTHYYKYKNISGRHLGADYNIGSEADDKGQIVRAIFKGVISKIETLSTWGNIIYILHDTSFGKYTSMYAHVDFLESGALPVGTTIDPGTPIAKVGNGTWNNCTTNKKSGKTSCKLVRGVWPYHLHFEIREGDNTYHGSGYTKCSSATDTTATCIMDKGPEGQINPNTFISSHR